MDEIAYAQGRREAQQWASRHRRFRVKARYRDFTAWLTSANGDHTARVQQYALGYLAGLQIYLTA